MTLCDRLNDLTSFTMVMWFKVACSTTALGRFELTTLVISSFLTLLFASFELEVTLVSLFSPPANPPVIR